MKYIILFLLISNQVFSQILPEEEKTFRSKTVDSLRQVLNPIDYEEMLGETYEQNNIVSENIVYKTHVYDETVYHVEKNYDKDYYINKVYYSTYIKEFPENDDHLKTIIDTVWSKSQFNYHRLDTIHLEKGRYQFKRSINTYNPEELIFDSKHRLVVYHFGNSKTELKHSINSSELRSYPADTLDIGYEQFNADLKVSKEYIIKSDEPNIFKKAYFKHGKIIKYLSLCRDYFDENFDFSLEVTEFYFNKKGQLHKTTTKQNGYDYPKESNNNELPVNNFNKILKKPSSYENLEDLVLQCNLTETKYHYNKQGKLIESIETKQLFKKTNGKLITVTPLKDSHYPKVVKISYANNSKIVKTYSSNTKLDKELIYTLDHKGNTTKVQVFEIQEGQKLLEQEIERTINYKK